MPAPTYRPANPESVFTYGATQLTFAVVTDRGVAGILRRSITLW